MILSATRTVLIACVLAACCAAPAASEEAPDAEPAVRTRPTRAPAGVTDADNYQEGRWGLTYRYSTTSEKDNLVGDEFVRPDDILAQGYTLAPVKRDIQQHWLGVRFNPYPRFSFYAEIPYHDITTRYETNSGSVSASSSGLGDIAVAANVAFMQKADEHLMVGVRVTMPTGDYSQTGDLAPAAAADQLLPYPMQLGGGTWSLAPILTYLGRRDGLTWGGQARGVYAIGRNSYDYSRSAQFHMSGWVGSDWFDWLEASMRLYWTHWANYHGADTRMDLMLSPSSDAKRQKGRRLYIGPSLNVEIPGFEGQRVAVEVLWPVYQAYTGPYLAREIELHVGYRLGF